MEDIFSGELVQAWKNGDFVFLSFPYVTTLIPLEDWDRVVTELKHLVIIAREKELEELKEDKNV